MTASAAEDRYLNLVGPTELRVTAEASAYYGSFVLLSGDITVNTDDYDTPTTGRGIYLRFGTKGDAKLTVKGRGRGILCNPVTQDGFFDKVTVDENSTLVLAADGTSYLETRELVLKAGAKLELTVGKQLVRAQKWTIDPTAQILVNVPAGCTQTAWAVAIDMMSGTVPFVSGQVVIQGDGSTGWQTVVESDAVAVVKPATGVDGTYDYEWTGGGTDDKFSTKDNWYCKSNPLEGNVNAFGAATTCLNPIFDHIYNSSGDNGYSVGTVYFRESAVRTFTIGGNSVTMTCSNNGMSSADTIAQWGVYSD